MDFIYLEMKHVIFKAPDRIPRGFYLAPLHNLLSVYLSKLVMKHCLECNMPFRLKSGWDNLALYDKNIFNLAICAVLSQNPNDKKSLQYR